MTWSIPIAAQLFSLPAGAVGWQIGFVLALLAIAVVLFAMEKISVDVITFCVLIPLILAGILTPEEAFKGFSSEAVVSLAAIFVISGALTSTGVLDLVGSRIMKNGGGGEAKTIGILMLIACAVSAVMNNTTVTAMFTPAVVVLARRTGISPSKILMPLAFAAIMGGTLTLIGTSTNIAVNNYLSKNGYTDIGMFEVTPAGLVICIVGMLYMMLIGRKQLVARADESLAANYGMREYLSEIIIMPGSPLIGQRSFDCDLSILEFRILKVIRGEEQLVPDSRVLLEQGDVSSPCRARSMAALFAKRTSGQSTASPCSPFTGTDNPSWKASATSHCGPVTFSSFRPPTKTSRMRVRNTASPCSMRSGQQPTIRGSASAPSCSSSSRSPQARFRSFQAR